MRNRPAVVAISGVKNSGKTTLITAMLPFFQRHGIAVAVIKHDGHRFPPDPPDTDTGRYLAHGACGAAIYDEETSKVIWRQPVGLDRLIALFPQADLVLLEGGKHTPWPKLEVVRKGNSSTPVCDPATMLALVTDTDLCLPSIPALPLDQPEKVAGFLLEYLRKEGVL